MFLPSGHVITEHGYHIRPKSKPKDTLEKGREATYYEQGDWNELAYIEAIIGQSDGTVSTVSTSPAVNIGKAISTTSLILKG